MKIGILFYGDQYLRNRDWSRTKDHIKRKIIDCWPDHEVKTYMCISPKNIPDDLINFYNPTKCIRPIGSIAGKILNGLEGLKTEDLDFIFVTRLDIIFFKKLSDLNFNFIKYNFLFKEFNHWDRPKVEWWCKYYTTDVIFAFPSRYIQQTIDSVNENLTIPPKPFAHLHALYSFIEPKIGKDNIHILSEEHMFSGSGYNKYYLLDRYDTTKGDLGPTTIEDFQDIRNKHPLDKIGQPFYQGDVFN